MAPSRPPGRPRVDPADRSVNLHVRLPARQYDLVYQQAQIARVSVGDYVRLRLPAPARDDPSHKD